MKNIINKSTSKLIALLLAISLIISLIPLYTFAENNVEDPVVIVSLGDSYSSGEGIEPFYGQNKSLFDKVEDEDWLAHRSTKSWPSLLEIPGVNGKTGNYRVGYEDESSVCKWYFAAVSGAETKHLKDKQQKKEYFKFYNDGLTTMLHNVNDTVYLPKQLDIFNDINDEVDYVTLTIGGNDVGFTDIVTTCATNCSYLHFGSTSKLEDTFDDLWENFDSTKSKIEKAYKNIEDAAGTQANIIVAGYPKLLDKNGKGAVINKDEATLVNKNVSRFNDEIEKIINNCRESGMNIHFVDVEAEFDKDGGHQAYSSNGWINKIRFGTNAEDIDDTEVASAYSIHPNEQGAKAYARCVNAKIAEIENGKNVGSLSGKICKASDRLTPVSNATIKISGNNQNKELTSDGNGNYSITLPVGTYQVSVVADGYIEFNAYATIEKNQNTYMETFLMVEGQEGETGVAIGKITNAITGYGLEGVILDARSGWNNDSGTVITSVNTDSSGNYTMTLPIGNYTLCARKYGYVSTLINIIVQKKTTSVKNGAITPNILGNDYRVVLTWGLDPDDLDSHVEGTLNSGESFHVYYGDDYAYDGVVEICNLDVDDTTSYGPETITLNTTTDKPYYYYIHHYSGYGSLATSNAQIKVYQGETLLATFNVPTDQGNEIYWNVFAIKNGNLIVKNTITSSPDLTY